VVRRSKRGAKGVPPRRYGRDVDAAQHAAYFAGGIEEPANLKEALEGDHAADWKAAADAEFNSLQANDTWDLVSLPTGRRALTSRWVFKVKRDEMGKVDRYKGRLVARGFAQQHGVDYEETYSPVVRFDTIRALLAHAVQSGLHVHQMDVETAFLNGELEEEVFMQQPEGYAEPGKEDLVCRLKKSLYGLKQSPRCWNKAFRDYMEESKFVQATADACVFVRGDTIVAVYVDDLILLAPSEKELCEVKVGLSNRFKMKDLGSLHYILGIGVVQEKGQISINQGNYIDGLLKRYGMGDCKPVATPADGSVQLVADDGYSNLVDRGIYQSMVGSLLYAAVATRPDIAQAVSSVSRFNAAPTEAHLTAVKRVLRYLKGSAGLCLAYRSSSSGGDDKAVGYSDADWAGDCDSRRSTTGSVFLAAGAAITWLSQRQKSVALSTTETEYVALCSSTQTAVWLRRLDGDLGKAATDATVVYEDNQGAIAVAKNPIGHRRTKHIDIKYHYTRERVSDRTIALHYCQTKEMVADIFTKPLARPLFEYLRGKLGMCSR
jgi:hypothetical protein